MKFLLLLIASLATAVSANANTIHNDSVSAAAATVWGEYLRPILQKDYADDNNAISQYIEGIKDGFSVPSSKRAFYRGVFEGITLSQRIAQMQDMGLPIDIDNFCESLYQSIIGNSTGFDQKSADQFLSSYLAKNVKSHKLSLESQEDFLSKQIMREGVIKTASGLVFETIIEGEGNSPVSGDKVKVTYTGCLSDGTQFDATETPIEFDVDRLVPGFTEGLKMMKPGGVYRLFIPAHLGYGTKGVQGVIPGNAVLDFSVKLIEVIKAN